MGRQSRRKRDLKPSDRSLPAELRPEKASYNKDTKLLMMEISTPQSVVDTFSLIRQQIGDMTPFHLKTYVMGECTVIVTRELGLWHLSIAHQHRYPNWHEICQARYRLMPPDRTIAMILPPENVYINYHKNCFQMVELDDKSAWSHDATKMTVANQINSDNGQT